MNNLWLVMAVCAVVAFALTGVMRSYALRQRLLDHPNERSSHSVATPRGGGVAIVLAFYLGLLWLWGVGLVSGRLSLALLGGIPVAAIGFVDDRGHVPARIRLLVHFLAAAYVVAVAGWPWTPEAGTVIAGLLLVVLVAWLVNLYNFMDGIDGVAGGEAVTVAAGAGLILWPMGDAHAAVLLAACSAGFLLWNWPPARIFMGDVGSGFLGLLIGALLVIAWLDNVMGLWVWAILLGVFMVDSGLTLVRRILRGERWYQAHRTHAYQHASRRFGHARVTLTVLAVNLLWLLPLAWQAGKYPGNGLILCAVAYAPLVLLAVRFRAGLPEENAPGQPQG